MSGHRSERLAALILESVARLVREEVRDPRIGFVTLTGVEVSSDLKHARVFVSRMGSPEERKEAMRALAHAAPFFRRAVAQHASLRHMPELAFVEDESVERGFRVEALLNEHRRQSEEN